MRTEWARFPLLNPFCRTVTQISRPLVCSSDILAAREAFAGAWRLPGDDSGWVNGPVRHAGVSSLLVTVGENVVETVGVRAPIVGGRDGLPHRGILLL